MHLLIPTLYHMKYPADTSKNPSLFNLTERPRTVQLLQEFMLDVLLMPYGWVPAVWFLVLYELRVLNGLVTNMCASRQLKTVLPFEQEYWLGLSSAPPVMYWMNPQHAPLPPPPREVLETGQCLLVAKVSPSLPQEWVSMLSRGWLERPSGVLSN